MNQLVLACAELFAAQEARPVWLSVAWRMSS